MFSPQGRQTAYSKPTGKPVVQPIEEQKLEDSQPPSSEPKVDLKAEPTVNFLFTLLRVEEPSEPPNPEEDLETQENRFLDREDWGARQTSEEVSHLQNACRRLQESLSAIQADNLVLVEKLQNLPSSLYENLREEVKAVQEEPRPSGKQGCSRRTGSSMATDERGHPVTRCSL
ncbi:uncharacterized protein [Saccopteryx bilineata]|uniref:uncharacterized protein isoform X2 n=1 Tax=Saccopteryx bilineata TaxID=59482 RepID=UPI00338E92EA